MKTIDKKKCWCAVEEICLRVSMASQPFVGPWPLFQLLHPIYSRLDSLDGGSALRKAATYTQDNINTEQTHTHIHALSGIRTYDPNVRESEDRSCFRPRGHCDRPVELMVCSNK
jgi:hypothetical protein